MIFPLCEVAWWSPPPIIVLCANGKQWRRVGDVVCMPFLWWRSLAILAIGWWYWKRNKEEKGGEKQAGSRIVIILINLFLMPHSIYLFHLFSLFLLISIAWYLLALSCVSLRFCRCAVLSRAFVVTAPFVREEQRKWGRKESGGVVWHVQVSCVSWASVEDGRTKPGTPCQGECPLQVNCGMNPISLFHLQLLFSSTCDWWCGCVIVMYSFICTKIA